MYQLRFVTLYQPGNHYPFHMCGRRDVLPVFQCIDAHHHWRCYNCKFRMLIMYQRDQSRLCTCTVYCWVRNLVEKMGAGIFCPKHDWVWVSGSPLHSGRRDDTDTENAKCADGQTGAYGDLDASVSNYVKNLRRQRWYRWSKTFELKCIASNQGVSGLARTIPSGGLLFTTKCT